ncbi:MAG: 4Fe-4S binding protein [Bdellovibrionales bacterium]|nr:4Fe-4S binding protein [Bdellovibrionales bacterium]
MKTTVPYLVGWGELRKEITEQYPDPVSSRTEDDLPPRTRGLLFNDIERCTGCLACSKVCPVGCIEIENEAGPDPEKKWVAVFSVDFSQCIFCGLCVESCQPASLMHTKQYEGSVYRVSDLKVGFGRGHVTQEQREKWDSMRKSEDFVF